MTAAKRLRAFLETHGISRPDAALGLGVSPSLLHNWLHGFLPSSRNRLAIEAYTRGEIKAADWGSRAEKAVLARVRPFDAGTKKATRRPSTAKAVAS